jgi:hypothetical protein
MKTLSTLLFCFLLTSLAGAETIYEIQYTTTPGGEGTYPSPFEGDQVTVSGIVTANYYFSSGYFIHDPVGGPWRGVLIWDETYGMPQVGEELQITGTVMEYSGLTEITDISSRIQLSASEPLPPATLAESGELEQEAFESCWSHLLDVTVTSPPDGDGQWRVDDGSGSCLLEDNLSSPDDYGITIETGMQFQQLSGIVIWRWGEFSLNPRSSGDLVVGLDQTIVTVENTVIPLDQTGEVAITISSLLPEWEVDHYQFNLDWEPTIAPYIDWQIVGTLSQNGTLTVIENGSTLDITFDCATPLEGSGTLLELTFSGDDIGTSPLTLSNFLLVDTQLTNLTAGEIEVIDAVVPTGDTLTVIQRPLLTIPALVCPGDTLEILCDADPGTADWNVSLVHPAMEVFLELVQTEYDAALTWWRLQALIPAMPFYEQFDLKVNATGLTEDVSRRAVRVSSEVADDFFFAHVTDTHLPTHMYHYENGAQTDSSEMRDLRAVLDDLAIINPAFILLTGDLVNEGELEDYLFWRCYTRAKGILGESLIPIYLSAGNHDLGGWNDTPPSEGTARRDWWRFFGWSLCDDPPAGYPYFTQNYSFDYGPLHVSMLEAYDNYDSWRYEIYGSTSFTSGQLDWLEDDLAATSQPLQVIGHHFDFANQLNLNSLGVDISLWGHIHSSSGSIYQQPYDLSTDNTCDGDRAFRLIRVEGDDLQPLTTMSSGGSGQNLRVAWSSTNDGTADTLTAIVTNQFGVDFPEGLLRFYLSPHISSCEVSGGTLLQLIQLPDATECQVSVALEGSSTTEVTVMGMPLGPQNLYIQIYQQQLLLTWDPMPGATSYRVHLAAEPFGAFQDVSGQGDFNDTTWTAPIPPERGFYRVTGVY